MNVHSVNISVIVCTFNREKYIINTLEHLLKQKKVNSHDYEVIIINNNSTDNTEKICVSFIKENKLSNFHYFNEDKQGHTFARNRGIAESKGMIISFLDDDAFVTENYIFHIFSFFNQHPKASAIGGKIEPFYESSKPSWMSKYLLPLVAALDLGNEIMIFPKNKFPIGANMAFRKIVFDNYGDFNVNLGRRGTSLEGGDEKELFIRLRRGKELIYYVPQVKVMHVIPDSRTKNDYIKNMAIGVGTSEKKRLRKSHLNIKFNRLIQEVLKIFGTSVLFIFYSFKGRFKAAFMLVKFRIWVINGFLK